MNNSFSGVFNCGIVGSEILRYAESGISDKDIENEVGNDVTEGIIDIEDNLTGIVNEDSDLANSFLL